MLAKQAAVCGASTSGRLLAWAMIVPSESGDILVNRATRLFHLPGRSLEELRAFAAGIHKFICDEDIKQVAFCRTATGYGDDGLADEVRIEAALHFISGLKPTVHDGEEVSDWARRMQPSLPVNCRTWPPALAQIRAIEVAQWAQHR
jgi:hypothetical protein